MRGRVYARSGCGPWPMRPTPFAALIDAVLGWARVGGARRLLLDVGDHNQPAIALYARKGFEPNGETGSYPAPRNHIREHQRELQL